jgi:hypothetical protein
MTPETLFNLVQQATELRNEARANDDAKATQSAQANLDELNRALSYKLTLRDIVARERTRALSEAN